MTMTLRRWKVTIQLGGKVWVPTLTKPGRFPNRRTFFVRATTQEQAEEFAKMALRLLERKDVTLEDMVMTALLRERGKDEESE